MDNRVASGTPDDLLSGISTDLYPRIYMAALTHDGTCNREERNGIPGAEILNKRGMVDEIVGKLPDRNVLAVSWSGCGDSYPLLLSEDAQARTPAYALYREYCKTADASFQKACIDSADDEDFQTPMTIRWGAFAPAAQVPFYAVGACQHYGDATVHVPLYRRIWVAVQQFFVAMVNGLDAVTSIELKLPCPAVSVLPAAAFNPPTITNKYEDLNRLINGNLVLIGAKLPGVPDAEVSPVHGLVSGVELHAMALDNLLTLHDGYARATLGEWLQRCVDLVVLLMVAGLLVVFSPDSPREETWIDVVLPFLGLAFWTLYVTFWCRHGDWALAVFGLLGWACLDYFRADATAEVVLHFALVCCIALLALWWGIPTRNFVVLALTAAGLYAAVKAKIDDSPDHEQSTHSLLRKYVLPRLRFGARRNLPSSSERSSS